MHQVLRAAERHELEYQDLIGFVYQEYLRLNQQGLKRIAQRNPRRLRRGKLANRDIISMPFEDSPRLAARFFNEKR